MPNHRVWVYSEHFGFFLTRVNPYSFTGCGAVGSAIGLGPMGRMFESCHPDNPIVPITIGFTFYFLYIFPLSAVMFRVVFASIVKGI